MLLRPANQLVDNWFKFNTLHTNTRAGMERIQLQFHCIQYILQILVLVAVSLIELISDVYVPAQAEPHSAVYMQI